METALVATLGAEPQVISLATALLLRSGIALCSITVLHTFAERAPLAQALPALQAAFAAHPEWPSLRTVCAPVADVLTPTQFDRFSDTLYAALQVEIAAGRQVHLLLAGGRKSMAMLGMSVAQLMLGPEDRVWYLHSDEALRRSGRMELAEGDQATLIAVPLVRAAPAPLRFTAVVKAATPAAARQLLSDTQHARLAHFVLHELTPAERELAALVAQEVLTVAEMAGRLQKAPKTITNQLNSIYSKLESAFGLQADRGVKREFLRRELGEWFGS